MADTPKSSEDSTPGGRTSGASPDPSYTPSYQPNPSTGTQPTPESYQPPAVPLSIDHDPPHDARFHTPKFHKRGGMGRVFVAKDHEFNRKVALKDIQPQNRDLPTYQAKFLFEAEITGELEHPGIVPVYCFHRPSDARKHPHYAMRFVEGDTLASAIKTFHSPQPGKTLSSEQILQLHRLIHRFLTICQTVAYAHSREIIHRDLKPDNVMVGPFGETLVVDWGLAKRLKVEETAPNIVVGEHTRTTANGTPSYRAPEQAQSHLAHLQDKRTDVYGLGAILFAILTGHSPHPTGQHAPEPPSPKESSEWVDVALDAIVRKALAIEQDQRYQSALELAAAVEQWLADQPVAAQRTTVNLWRELCKAEPENANRKEQLARQLSNLGQVYQGVGRDTLAVEALCEAAQHFEQLYQRNREVRLRTDRANCLLQVSLLYRRLGDVAKHDEFAAEAKGIYSQLMREQPERFTENVPEIELTFHGSPMPNLEEITRNAARSNQPSTPKEETTQIHPPSTAKNEDSTVSLPSPAIADEGTQFDLSVVEEHDAKDLTAHGPASTIGVDLPEIVVPNIPGYEIVQELGRGGMATVYLARDVSLRRQVAIKMLDIRYVNDSAVIRRFEREAKIVAQLSHPNIVTVHSAGKTEGRYYAVYEYVAGVSLHQAARVFHESKQVLSPSNTEFRKLISVVYESARALHYAHQRGVLHRDPKPHNIMIRPNHHALVFDWGLCRVLRETERFGSREQRISEFDIDPELTDAGGIMGTPAYMSPEQVRDATKCDSRSDVYMLGGTLFLVLTGKNAVVGEYISEILMNLIEGKIHRPREVRPDVPKELDQICGRAMALNPAERFASANELAQALRAWANSK